jgi:site-specific recombinase XerD
MLPNQDEAMLVKFEESLTQSALAPRTIANYLADLRVFLRWGKAEIGQKFSLTQVSQDHIRLYRYYLAQELNRTASTVNRRLMALRKFFALARQLGFVPQDPTTGVSLVQEDGQAPSRPLAPDEVEKLLAAAQNGSRAGLVRRDVAIMQLLLHTGLRVTEIVELQRDDVVFADPGAYVVCRNHSGNSKIRSLPLPGKVYKALTEYLEVRPQMAATDHFFLCQDGRPLSQRTVQRIIGDCAREVGLKDVSAQSLRRTFALQLFAETSDLELVSERLGHQNKTITEQYLSVHHQLRN